MGGEYGDLGSRAAFRSALAEALALARSVAARFSESDALASVVEQLAHMEATTARRDPTEEERDAVDVGLVAVRELEAIDDEDVADLSDAIHPLAAFYEDWPTDEEAARALAEGA